MGRCKASLSLLSRFHLLSQSQSFLRRRYHHPTPFRHLLQPPNSSPSSVFRNNFFTFRSFSALPAESPIYSDEFEHGACNYDPNYYQSFEPSLEDDESGKISVRAFFLCTSIDLKSMQAENSSNIIPPSSRSTNYISLKFCDIPTDTTGVGGEVNSICRHMVVFQYGSAILFNVEDHEVESYLNIVKKHATGILQETRKDEYLTRSWLQKLFASCALGLMVDCDYAVKEKPSMNEDMKGGPDYIVLKHLDTDSIRIIGSVLGQSIALDYFVSQVDGMVEEFTDINRVMEKTGNFTMTRKKLFQLVGKANSNLADVILRVGLFDRSEIAWREAKYAKIFEYLREEYEVAQRFGNLDFKLKFVEHNIHFLQEVLQNRKSDLLEWCIIILLSIENVISISEILRESTAIPIPI